MLFTLVGLHAMTASAMERFHYTVRNLLPFPTFYAIVFLVVMLPLFLNQADMVLAVAVTVLCHLVTASFFKTSTLIPISSSAATGFNLSRFILVLTASGLTAAGIYYALVKMGVLHAPL